MHGPLESPVIRAAGVAEAEAVLALWRAADSRPSVTDTPAALRRLIREHPGSLLVAELDGQLAGTIIAGWDGWRGTLYRLAVLPQLQRRGIGRALVVEALRRFRERGIERVSVFAVEADQAAVAFWNSLADLGIVADPAPKVRYVVNLG